MNRKGIMEMSHLQHLYRKSLNCKIFFFKEIVQRSPLECDSNLRTIGTLEQRVFNLTKSNKT